jgi:hypothetical protein
MNTKTVKKIQKYSRLRFEGNPLLSGDKLKRIYKKSSPEQQKKYMLEMNTYFQALEEGRIKPGQSIVEVPDEVESKDDTTNRDETNQNDRA